MEKRRAITTEEIDNILGEHITSLDEYIRPYIQKDVDPITEHVYVVYEGDAIYEELKTGGHRGLCRAKDGYIYIRNDVDWSPNLLIHEFIHRLSRNRKFVKAWPIYQSVLGLDQPRNCLHYVNEIITEMIAVSITGIEEERNPYTFGLDLMRQFANKVGAHNLIKAYFEGNVGFLKRKLSKCYKNFAGNFAVLISCYSSAQSETGGIEDMRNALEAEYKLQIIIGIL